MTIEESPAYSDRYELALRLAAASHREQERKGGVVPYVTHPFHVSLILRHYGFAEDVCIAGLLHDVVEDQEVPLERIVEQFGPRVAEIVAALTERKKNPQGGKRPWAVRKREALEDLAQAPPEALAVKAADALHNVRCTLLDLDRLGDAVWGRFNSDALSIAGYYRRILQLARERLGPHPLVGELGGAVEELQREVAGVPDGS
ncbi:MAG: bifunctional (p)ppGpp synthetase/guanosine-3',5'-bis(diphosphate) 3'-pyrophosphohydrolase [Chloroflexia bacterium]|nr:bifunctional (p)ppGpp synthetase/guanosine-3',5'-bis(diphosphate) 3'-pyrophosphohydrolase [Chloroflexia bacterium]